MQTGGAGALEVHLLGPVRVSVDGAEVRLGSARQRAILASLALSGGRVVSMTRLCDDLWPEEPPEGAVNAVQVHVSQLRRALGPAGARIETRAPGYRLDVDREAVDALDFEQRCERARGGDGMAWRTALALWSGETALEDLAGLPFAAAQATRLDVLRLAALEEAVDGELQAGRHAAVVGELEGLVRVNPYRERLWRQLMLALYRCGRQADALAAYRQAASLFADELGLNPGPALTALERAVLTQDPGLDIAPAHPGLGKRVPEPLAALVGREADVAAVRGLLAERRLVTITGPGGAGKTSLALAVAHLLLAEMPDGVLMLDLSDVRDVEQVLPAIAAAVDADPTEPASVGVVARLTGRRALLVLDNLEQVIESAASLGALLRETTEVRMLVTSRVALRLGAEQRYPLGPLDDASAAALFVRQARLGRPALSVDGAVVTRLCRRLDGLPLAIVLAAAACRVLPPEEVHRRLENRLVLLTGDTRDLPDRQRTLRATLAWSVELLDDRSRELFIHLGIFAAPLTVGAAEHVCGVGIDIVDAIAALVDASLLTVDGDRLRMLETVRDYSRELLMASGSADEVAERHVSWVLSSALDGERRLAADDDENAALADLIALLPEVRVAVDRLLRLGRHADAAGLLLAMRRAAFSEGLFAEFARELGRADPELVDARLGAEIMATRGLFLKMVGGEDAGELLRRSVEALRPLNLDTPIFVNTLCHLAAFQAEAGEADDAVELADEAVASAARCLDPGALAMALDLSAYVARTVGDPERAVQAARSSVAAARRRPGAPQLLNCLAGLTAALAEAGEPDEALAAGLEALARSGPPIPATQRAETVMIIAGAIGKRAPVALAQPLGEAVALWTAIGAWPNVKDTVAALARMAAGVSPADAVRLVHAASLRPSATTATLAAVDNELEKQLGVAAWRSERAAGVALSDDELTCLAATLAARVSEGGAG